MNNDGSTKKIYNGKLIRKVELEGPERDSWKKQRKILLKTKLQTIN